MAGTDLITHSFLLEGVSPLLLHSGQTVDPLNQFTKAAERIKKRAKDKTEEDLARESLIQWWGGLYLSTPAIISEDGDVSVPDGTSIVIPAHQIDSCIREGARKTKDGKTAAAGVIVESDGKLIHNGPADLMKLVKDERFHYRCPVKVAAARVMRTRPRFDSWGITFSVAIDPGVAEVDDVKRWLIAAGRFVGIGDWRPGAPRGGNFGRFVVTE